MRKCSPLVIPFRHFSLSRSEWSTSLPKPDYGPGDVQRSTLLSGVKIAAAKTFGAQMAACTIMYQVGSRHEQDNEIGATHFIRTLSSGSSRGCTSFIKGRFLPQYGASITCSSNRQAIYYTMRCPTAVFPKVRNYLLDTATRGCYKQWEIDDFKPLIWDDLHRIHPEQRVLDLVQRACWGGPLSNSMFCEHKRINSMNVDNLLAFSDNNMRSDVCSVATVGVPLEETLKLAELVDNRIELQAKRCYERSFPRRGYEVYDLGRNSTTWIAVAIPGCGSDDVRCLMKHAIIAAACGTGNIAMGSHSMDRSPQSPLGLMSGDDVYTNYKAFNISYKDTGVFGIVAKTRASTAWNVALAASEFLTNVGDLNFKQIAIGKQRLKLSFTLNDENAIRLSENLALQSAYNVTWDNIKEALMLIDCITPDEVTCAARILNSKKCDMALAVVGDVSCVPHDRELFC